MHDVLSTTDAPGRISGALRHALGSWDGLLESLPIAVYVCDTKGLIVQYNRRAAELWGRAPEPGDTEQRFCGSRRMFLVDGRLLPHAEGPTADVLTTGRAVRNASVLIERSDGSRVSALMNIDPLLDDDGGIVGAVNCFQDVTELQRAHDELQHRQAELEDFFENGAVALHIVDADGTILRANQAELDLLGYRREEYVGRNISEFHAKSDSINEILGRLRRGDRLDHFPMQLRTKDGGIRDVLITSSAQFRDGKFINTRCFTIDVTDRKHAEATLRDQGRRLAATYEHATVGIAEVDADGRRVRINEAACKITGRSREELIGGSIFDHNDPVDIDKDRDQFRRLVAGEIDRYTAEKRYFKKDGTPVWLTMTCAAVRDTDRKFLYAVRVFDDITQSKVMADALAESEQRLAATYEQATIGISEVDAHGRMLRVNEASCALTGRSREELLSRGPFFDYMRPDEARIERKLYRRQVAGELARYSIEKRIRRKDGSEIWALVMSSSVCDVNGRFRYAVRVIQDITERREAEERLRASEQRLRVLLEGLPAAIYMTDAEGRIIFFNQAAVDFSGRTPTLGTDEWCVTWKLYRPDGTPMPHEECPMAIALKEGRPIRDAEAIAERPDGTRVPFIPYPTPIFDADGKLTGAINMLVDVTEQKKAESRQKTLIDELNHRVKNTLATVQSLVRQTARGTSSIKAFEERLQGRLIALSQAHDQLTRGNWQRADLRAILTGAFSPYGEEMAEQVAVAGVPVELSPRAALALAMVFHELITNAVKYGSLSQHTGKLKVDWRVERHKSGDTLRLRWCETGGPKVKRPERRGFGTQMVERSIPAELGGRAALRFESTGVVCELEFPLAEIGDQESEQSQRSTRLRRRG